MKPTEILREEHKVILRVLLCLERMVDAAARTGRLDADDAGLALDFVQAFADRIHHGKEEACLFPLLEQRGLPADQGPLAVMRYEHETGRAHVRAMRDHCAGAADGDAAALAAFTREARGFLELLRGHIYKEDNILFPLGESVLRDEDRAAMAEQYARADASHPPGTHERMRAAADSLCEKYGVGEEEAIATSRGTCGG